MLANALKNIPFIITNFWTIVIVIIVVSVIVVNVVFVLVVVTVIVANVVIVVNAMIAVDAVIVVIVVKMIVGVAVAVIVNAVIVMVAIPRGSMMKLLETEYYERAKQVEEERKRAEGSKTQRLKKFR